MNVSDGAKEFLQSDWAMDPVSHKPCTFQALKILTELLEEQKQSAEEQIASINTALELIKRMQKNLEKGLEK